jgi:hypothetical protein
MRKILSGLAGGAVVIMLSTPPAHAASPAHPARQVGPRSSQIEDHHRGDDDRDGDDWDRDRYDDRWDRCHRHGLVGALLHWLI